MDKSYKGEYDRSIGDFGICKPDKGESDEAKSGTGGNQCNAPKAALSPRRMQVQRVRWKGVQDRKVGGRVQELDRKVVGVSSTIIPSVLLHFGFTLDREFFDQLIEMCEQFSCSSSTTKAKNCNSIPRSLGEQAATFS